MGNTLQPLYIFPLCTTPYTPIACFLDRVVINRHYWTNYQRKQKDTNQINNEQKMIGHL